MPNFKSGRLQCVIDGVVHYDNTHFMKDMQPEIDKLKKHVDRGGYSTYFEITISAFSGFARGAYYKLNRRDMEHAVSLIGRYDLYAIARRYKITVQTLIAYRKLLEDENKGTNTQ